MPTATRKLIIRGLEEIKSGTGSRGPWTLFAVKAADEAGQVITESLRTFERLPLNQLIEVAVELQQHEKFGPSFLLKLPETGGSLRARVAAVEQELAGVLERLSTLERGSSS